MLKPNNYDTTTAYGDYDPIEIGGHIMVIQNVEEAVSRTGKPMLNISLDTAREDSQPGYFMDRWKNDNRPADKKKWGCIVYQLVEDDNGNCNRGLKTFITSVEESNPGFQVQWGDNFTKCFNGKKVGGVFRREQFKNRDGELKWSVKCFAFRSVQAVLDGIELPDDKYLNRSAGGSSGGYSPYSAVGGFQDISDQDGNLPF